MSKAKRFGHTSEVGKAIIDIRKSGAGVKSRLHRLMMQLLPPAHKEVYDWFILVVMADEENPYITASEVVDRFGYKPNYASMLLKDLVDFGLLEREYADNEYGRHYVYKYASWEGENWHCE